jgi:hypothetical protein
MSRSARVGSLRHIECLESRQLLAGDVAISVVDGNLLIRGDELANQIAITAGDAPDSYRIVGLDGTTVHTVATAEPSATQLLVSGVTGNVAIRMGAGDDVVRIHGASFHGNVSIATDGGSDHVVLGTSPVAVSESDSATNGDEPVFSPQVDGVGIGGSLRIATGADDDTVRVAQTAVRGNLLVFSDGGDDEVIIGEPSQDPTVTAAAEAPSPSVEVGHTMAIHLGAGNDALALQNAEAYRGVLVDGGGGDDRMRLSNLLAGDALRVLGGLGEGADDVVLENVRSRHVLVHTGDGNDRVKIVDSTFGQLAVMLGAGDDNLAIGGVNARLALFLGDAGTDALTLLAENIIGRRIVRGFENLPADPASTA